LTSLKVSEYRSIQVFIMRSKHFPRALPHCHECIKTSRHFIT
jgi:hypothetical protein